jgi:hypothetical protein
LVQDSARRVRHQQQLIEHALAIALRNAPRAQRRFDRLLPQALPVHAAHAGDDRPLTAQAEEDFRGASVLRPKLEDFAIGFGPVFVPERSLDLAFLDAEPPQLFTPFPVVAVIGAALLDRCPVPGGLDQFFLAASWPLEACRYARNTAART